jgi:hypothetical protein
MSQVKTTNKSKEPKPSIGWIIFVLTIIFVFLIWGLNWFFVWNFFGRSDERGDFGGMFGAVSALFSGLAFATLIYTIWLQREELKLQREELKLQRKALELQAAELKRQADELTKTVSLQETSLEIQKKQFEHTQEIDNRNQERATRAHFVQSGNIIIRRSDGLQLILHLRNTGALASSVKITGDADLNPNNEYRTVGPEVEIALTWSFEPRILPDNLHININYIDTIGKRQTDFLLISKDTNSQIEDEMYKVVPAIK